MQKKSSYLILLAVVASLAAGAGWAWYGQRPDLSGAVEVARPPRISPDYAGVVVPPNIAPLNFVIREEGRRFVVQIHSESGESIEIVKRSGEIIIPARRWRTLLEANRGKPLCMEVYCLVDAQWQHYQTIVNRIAEEAIDGYLVYRLVGPIHNKWRQTAIRQRDLAGFEDRPVLDGKWLEHGCVNCHSFPANDPERMLLGMRSAELGNATLLADGDTAVKLGAPFGYTAWHPSGQVAAYSVNKVRQFFHTAGPEVRDVIDMDGGLAYLRVDARQSKRVPRGPDEERLATYPAWSPDGRHLYYCSAPFLWTDRNSWPPQRYAEVKYDLMRISYDIEADRWGRPETVLAAENTGLSILMPRVSPDGAHLLFCMCQYGCFPAYQPSSDLYLMRLADRTYHKLPINSAYSEAYHSWSSNARWIAFSSRCQGGFLARCYLSYVDASGQAHKPLVLPQRDPAFYESLLKSLCVPELVTGPVRVPESTLVRAARSPEAVALGAPPGESPKLEALEPYQPAGEH